MGVIEEFVDGPLIVGVPSVFERGWPGTGSDMMNAAGLALYLGASP